MSSPRTPSEIHDASYRTLTAERERFGSIWDDLKQRLGFPTISIESVIFDAEFRAVLAVLDSEEDKNKRNRQLLIEIERKGDDLLAQDEARSLVESLLNGQKSHDMVVSWLNEIMLEDGTLIVTLHDFINKTGSEVIRKRERAVFEVNRLVQSLDLESKEKQLDDYQKSNKDLLRRIRDSEFSLAAQRTSLKNLKEENANLNADLAMRPIQFEVEGEKEKYEQSVRDILERGHIVSTFPRRWSELKEILDEQAELSDEDFQNRLAEVQKQLNEAEVNRKEANEALEKERNMREISERSLDALKTRHSTLEAVLQNTTSGNNAQKQAQDAEVKKAAENVKILRLDLLQKEIELQRRTADYNASSDESRRSREQLAQLNDDFNKFKLDAAKEAGNTGGDVRVWTEKYNAEVKLREQSELSAKSLAKDSREQVAKLEHDLKSKDASLIKNVEEVRKLTDRASIAETNAQVAGWDLENLKKKCTELNATIQDQASALDGNQIELSEVRGGLKLEKEKIQTLERRLQENEQSFRDLQMKNETARQEYRNNLNDSARAEALRIAEADRKSNEAEKKARLTEQNLQDRLDAAATGSEELKQRIERMERELRMKTDDIVVAQRNFTEIAVELEQSKTDVLLKSSTIEELRSQLSTSDQHRHLHAQIERTNKVSVERDDARRQAESYQMTVSDWNRVIVDFQYAHTGTIDPSQALPFLRTEWLTNQESIQQKRHEMLHGFELYGSQCETALGIWVRSVCDPASLSLNHIISLFRNEIATLHIGFIVTAVLNVINLELLSDDNWLFILRSIEFLHLIMYGYERLHSMLTIFRSKEANLPDVPIIRAFYICLTDRLAGRASTPGARLNEILPDDAYVELNDGSRAYMWGDVIIIAGQEHINIYKSSDIKLDVDGDKVVVWIKGYPKVNEEATARLDFNRASIVRLGQVFPTATWDVNY